MIIKTPIVISRSQNRQGFSLVELLVSITIIIVLAALVFTVTRKIRTSAQQATAMSALRQIGIAQAAYAAENNGAINVVRDTGEWGSGHEGPGSRFASNSFWGRMQPHLFAGIETNDERALAQNIKSSLSALFGTTDIKTMAGTIFNGVPVYGDGSGISLPLAFNINLKPVWRQPPLLTSAVGDPSRILYCTYGRYLIDQTHGSAYLPLPLPGDRRRAIYFLPNRKAIACFLDGHVELLSPPIPERNFKQPDA